MNFVYVYIVFLIFIKLVLINASNHYNGVGIYCSDTFCNQMVISKTNMKFEGAQSSQELAGEAKISRKSIQLSNVFRTFS